jgi:chromosome segregation ATPase
MLVLLAALGETAWAQGERTVYCCDVGGQPVCGDILQPACYGRAYREIGAQGTVRHISAPLTAAELAEQEKQARLRREEETRLKRQERLDRALRATYPTIEELDKRRDREMSEFDQVLADLRFKEKELLEQRKNLNQEGEALQGKPLPAELDEAIRNLDGEINAHRSVITAKEQERDATRKRFDDDRRRYLELPGAKSTSPHRVPEQDASAR